MKIFLYDTNLSISWHRLLRRSVQGSVHYSAIASQFTLSVAKGRTLVRSVILFGRNKPQRTRVKGVYAELLCETSASFVLSGKKN